MSGSDVPPEREALFRDAVAFLRDVKVSTSPLAQKIQFLESKGLTSAEIEKALIRASSTSSNETPNDEGPAAPTSDAAGHEGSQQVYNHAPEFQGSRAMNHVQYGPPGRHGPSYGQQMRMKPELPQRDWRDYFIMAVISGGVMYGMVSLAKKFLLPHLQPPTTTAFEQTSNELTAQFDEATQLLADLQKQTGELQESVAGERSKVDKVVGEVEEAVDAVRKGEQKWREEMRDLRDEIEEVKDLVPKMIDKHAQAQASSLQELQAELKSLRTLLMARNKPLASPSAIASSAGRPTSPFAPASQTPQGESEISMAANALLAPRVPAASTASGATDAPRPSIPAWQMAAASASRPATPASEDAKSTPGPSTKAEGKKVSE
ncbi:peroxisomal membrane protein pex14 [Naganishia albida]|nr:peroxisomal membrane protein pex14 [Naganishia albida]